MSQDSEQQGPSMVCATSAIDTGPARVGHLFGKVNLPRTVELPTAIATVAGGVIGLIVAAVLPGGGLQKWIFTVLFCATVGYFLMNFSPMRGESLAKWLGLQVSTLRRSRMVNGKPVIIAIGSKVASREVLGEFRLVRSAVHVPVGAYDERGVFKSERNHNLDTDARPAAEMTSRVTRTAPGVVSPASAPVISPLNPVDITPAGADASEAPSWARMRGSAPASAEQRAGTGHHPTSQQPVQQPAQMAAHPMAPQPPAAPAPAQPQVVQPGVPQHPSPYQPASGSGARAGLPEGAPPWARQLTAEPEPTPKPGRRRKERGQ